MKINDWLWKGDSFCILNMLISQELSQGEKQGLVVFNTCVRIPNAMSLHSFYTFFTWHILFVCFTIWWEAKEDRQMRLRNHPVNNCGGSLLLGNRYTSSVLWNSTWSHSMAWSLCMAWLKSMLWMSEGCSVHQLHSRQWAQLWGPPELISL